MAFKRTAGIVPVAAAFIGNLLVTIIKAAAAAASGSSVMFSEAIHSLADTANQLLLLIGVERSFKKSDDMFRYGYGGERFFWAVLSACGIFFGGAGVSLYKGISSILHPPSVEISASLFVVLAASFCIESFTFWIAARGLKRAFPRASWRERLALADPSTLAVYLEDSIALMGVGIAAASVSVSYYTGNVFWDALGSIIIAALLGIIAIALIVKNRSYLLGRAIPENEREEILAALMADPAIERVIDFKSSVLGIGVYRIKCEVEFNGAALLKDSYHRKYLRERYGEIKDDYDAFSRFCAEYADRIPRLMGKKIDDIENMLRKRFPAVHHIDIEIN